MRIRGRGLPESQALHVESFSMGPASSTYPMRPQVVTPHVPSRLMVMVIRCNVVNVSDVSVAGLDDLPSGTRLICSDGQGV